MKSEAEVRQYLRMTTALLRKEHYEAIATEEELASVEGCRATLRWVLGETDDPPGTGQCRSN